MISQYDFEDRVRRFSLEQHQVYELYRLFDELIDDQLQRAEQDYVCDCPDEDEIKDEIIEEFSWDLDRSITKVMDEMKLTEEEKEKFMKIYEMAIDRT